MSNLQTNKLSVSKQFFRLRFTKKCYLSFFPSFLAFFGFSHCFFSSFTDFLGEIRVDINISITLQLTRFSKNQLTFSSNERSLAWSLPSSSCQFGELSVEDSGIPKNRKFSLLLYTYLLVQQFIFKLLFFSSAPQILRFRTPLPFQYNSSPLLLFSTSRLACSVQFESC